MIHGLSGSLWPIHLKPYSDELLSSWLVRLAHAHGLKLQTFCNIVFGRGKNIWNRDIDKLAPEWLIEHLSVATGTSIERVYATTLKSYEGIIYEKHQPNGNTRWINPLGVYHRVHNNPGLHFCPLCLSLDMDPYYRKQWRLAFYTTCPKHQILMHQRCPNCSKTINFHRVEMGVREQITPRAMSNCYFCNFDLRKSPIYRQENRDWKTNVAFYTLLDLHEIGWSFIENLTVNYSIHMFDVLRHLCVIMSANRRANCLLPIIAKKMGIDISQYKFNKSILLEKYPVLERHFLFNSAIWLLLDWPDRFIEICSKKQLSKAYLMCDKSNMPFWFYEILDRKLNKQH